MQLKIHSVEPISTSPPKQNKCDKYSSSASVGIRVAQSITIISLHSSILLYRLLNKNRNNHKYRISSDCCYKAIAFTFLIILQWNSYFYGRSSEHFAHLHHFKFNIYLLYFSSVMWTSAAPAFSLSRHRWHVPRIGIIHGRLFIVHDSAICDGMAWYFPPNGQ